MMEPRATPWVMVNSPPPKPWKGATWCGYAAPSELGAFLMHLFPRAMPWAGFFQALRAEEVLKNKESR